MRMIVFMVIALGFIGMQGCASVGGTSSQHDLKALPLFNVDSQPQFSVYLACRGVQSDADLQCATVDNAFYAWASARHIQLKAVNKDAPMMHAGHTPAVSDNSGSVKPYRLAILVEPVIVPTRSGTGGTMPSGYVSGRVGYNATVSVFSTSSGSLVGKLSTHPRQELPQHANVTPAIKSQIHDLIARIDPAYSS